MAIDALIGSLFGTAFGGFMTIGLVGLVVFIIFLVGIKVSFEGAFALFMGFIHLVAFFGMFGEISLMLRFGILLVDGIIIAIAVLRLLGRH